MDRPRDRSGRGAGCAGERPAGRGHDNVACRRRGRSWRFHSPFGPPVLQKPSAELLGEELLAAGRKAEAADAFRAALAAAPNRRLSVRGLAGATAQ